MIPRTLLLFFLAFPAAPLAPCQAPSEKKPVAAQAPNQLADELAQRLSRELNVKTVVGDPIKAGSVTLIPIMTIDVSFGGGGMAVPPAKDQPAPPSGFLTTGEARPLGFVAITKKGVRFISTGKSPDKAAPPAGAGAK